MKGSKNLGLTFQLIRLYQCQLGTGGGGERVLAERREWQKVAMQVTTSSNCRDLGAGSSLTGFCTASLLVCLMCQAYSFTPILCQFWAAL